MSIRIILVDEQQVVREGIRALLEAAAEMEVVADVSNIGTAMERLGALSPDILITDVAPGDTGVIEATREIAQRFPSVRVVALTAWEHKLFVMGMLRAGASGYVLKECSFAELLHGIKAAMAHEIYVSPRLAGGVIASQMNHPTLRESAPTLTHREAHVLRRLAEGRSSKEIAGELRKSVQTIDACRRETMHKLGIDNIADLIKYAIREGLASLT